MSSRSQNRNNAVAGLFLSVSVVLGASIIIVLSGVTFGATQLIHVTFSLQQGAAGLQPGSTVTLGGLEVGKVASLEIEADPQTGVVSQLVADVRVRSSVKMYSDARVELVVPLLGGTSSLNITSVGVGPNKLTESDIIHATMALPTFLSQAGYGPDQAEQVRAVINNVYELTVQVKEFSNVVTPELKGQIDALGRIMAEAEQIADNVTVVYPQWRNSISGALANTEAASDRFDGVVTRFDDSARNAGLFVNESREMLADNRPGIDAIVANTQSLTEKIDQQTIEEFNETLRALNTDLDQIMAWMRENWPGVRKIVSNMRLASDQLKLTMIEVRRAPWRLLYQPGTKELESELLYDSARTYAEAVSDLRAASEALEELQVAAQAGPEAGIEPEQIQRISAELEKAFERYHQAETDFLSRLIENQGNPK